MTDDPRHLQLLTIFHYVLGGIAGLLALFPIFHLGLGLFLIFAPPDPQGPAPFAQALFGWLIVVFATGMMIAGWAFAVLVLLAGRCLARRRRHLFCLVAAAIECIFMPFGTVLGVFTIIVLTRSSVRELFSAEQAVGSEPTSPFAQ